MWIDATIAFGGILLVGVVLMTVHWWAGREEHAERRHRERECAAGHSPSPSEDVSR